MQLYPELFAGVPIWLLVKRKRGRRRHPQPRFPGHLGEAEQQRHAGTGQQPAEGADGKPEAGEGPTAEAMVPALAVEPAEVEEQRRAAEAKSAEPDSKEKK
ncbi:hypothetical protein [Paenibacillus thiaminolyticus]|uniref:hypothetical protein n=1 Tax=Paenibacillus thiaminolyticus TaxID=49283 RepID=UPI001601AFBA|nr:hypothetical protein [Paenibacillus thiaminolyticus]